MIPSFFFGDFATKKAPLKTEIPDYPNEIHCGFDIIYPAKIYQGQPDLCYMLLSSFEKMLL